MENEIRAHEKVRFRRNEIADLAALPSSAPAQVSLSPRPARRRRRSRLHWVGVLFGFLAAVFVAAVFFIAVVGIPSTGMERLREQAERVGSRFAGEPVQASLGRIGISFDSSRLLALRISDVGMGAVNPGGPQISAGEVRVGLALWPLLQGRLQIGNAALGDARVVAGALQQNGEQDWAAGLKNEQGLIDPDKVLQAVFEGLHRAFDGLDSGNTSKLALQNVEIVLPGLEKTTRFLLRSATLRRVDDALTIAGELVVNGRTITLKGNALRPSPEQIAELSVAVDSGPIVRDDPLIDDGEATLDPSLGTLAVDLAGHEGINGEPSRLTASASMSGAAIDLGKNGIIAGAAQLSAELLGGAGKLAIKKAALQSGQTNLDFRGEFGPQALDAEPLAENGQSAPPPSYRFELTSDRSQLAAEGLDEPPLGFSAGVAGNYLPETRRLVVDDLRVQTGDGQLTGNGAIAFEGRRAPGITARLATSAMPVLSGKLLWPFFVAPNARNWVHQHVSEGRIVGSEIQLAIAPGRLGDGHALSAEEASGNFVVEDTQFSVVGELPTVSKAAGSILFGGNDVAIALDIGEALMSDNRVVTVSNGTMHIPGRQQGGTTGQLTLDLAGDGQAIAELASRKPIDALRFIGMAPQDVSGEVWGTVNAVVPLSPEVDRSRLSWNVDLAFDKLALAKPLSGQTITDASGTAAIDAQRAEVTAKARLNGLPADLNVVEPIGPSEIVRKRAIQLSIDEATRRKQFPALDALVSGPIVLDVDAAQAERQAVTADLANTEIRVPWAGWLKGAGVPAKLSFDLSARDGTTNLSNFRLSGESFAVAGDISLGEGGLAAAKFDTVSLNRGDKATLDLDRKGKGFVVRVRGSQFDARALVKHYLTESGGGNIGGTGERAAVTLDVAVDRATGFFNEAVNNLKVTYDSGEAGLRLTGVMESGGAVALQTDAAEGRTSMKLQATDAGAVLRFADMYQYMQGGRLELALAGRTGRPLLGSVEARDFRIVDEPKLRSLVASTPPEGKSLNETLNREIDTSSVAFERGFTRIQKGPGSLQLSEGVVRGPVIGASFQGTVYDPQGNMDMTGTFLPAYGVNRIFGEIPIIGQILGNGRDRALIGITFRLVGNAKKPELQINPISAIAPGIFRSIFEF